MSYGPSHLDVGLFLSALSHRPAPPLCLAPINHTTKSHLEKLREQVRLLVRPPGEADIELHLHFFTPFHFSLH